MQNRINLIFGKTGSGKSTLAKLLALKENRLIVIDVLDEYNDFISIYDFESLVEYITTHEDFRISCKFKNQTHIEYTFRIIFHVKNICILVEEAGYYISTRDLTSNFLDLVRFGRHANIKIIAVSRRFVELSSDLRAMTNVIYSFKQTYPNDIKESEKIGFTGLNELQDFNYLQQGGIPVENVNYKIIYL